jgi:(p)ppGpp synthase/HD superfamily hydrolase
MSTLERAIAIAAEAHAGQTDKAGAPYILHPLRLMLRMTSTEERIVAVLHDVVEDNAEWTLDRLHTEGFSDDVLAAIESVTKRPDKTESYEEFVLRAARNPIGRCVKLADFQDNVDLTRMAQPTPRDLARVKKYRLAIELLQDQAGSPVP